MSVPVSIRQEISTGKIFKESIRERKQGKIEEQEKCLR